MRNYCTLHARNYTAVTIDGTRVLRCPTCAEEGLTQRFVPVEHGDDDDPPSISFSPFPGFGTDASTFDTPSPPDSTPDTSSFDFGGGGGFDGGGGGDSF